MNFELKKSYTVEDLNEISGNNIIIFLSGSPTPVIPDPNKSPIYSFNDFDDTAKNVYSSLYGLISSLNPSSEFLLFATGKRVTGKWLTEQEANNINNEYNVNLKASPYEYWTTATNLPSLLDTTSLGLGVEIISNPSNETHRVIIPPNE